MDSYDQWADIYDFQVPPKEDIPFYSFKMRFDLILIPYNAFIHQQQGEPKNT